MFTAWQIILMLLATIQEDTVFGLSVGATQRGYGVVIPSGLLDPVTGDTFELGFKTRSVNFRSSLFTYYTMFKNWQVALPGTFQGSDWYDFNGNGVEDASEKVYVMEDSGDAYVYGVEYEAELELGALSESLTGFSAGGGFAWNYGNDKTTREPIRHTQPFEGKLFLAWERPDLKLKPWVKITASMVDRYDPIASDILLSEVGFRIDLV